MPTCSICKHYTINEKYHKCPPTYIVQDIETDCYDLIEIYASNKEEAAREYVERMDSECGMEYTYGKNERTVIVTSPEGEATTYVVYPEATIVYWASEKT